MATIFIIEDDVIMLTAMSNILTRSGYNIITANNGKEAFLKLDKEKYDLVITDLMMPYYNGLEIVSKLRTDITKRNVGIIVVSSVGNAETITELFRLGANDYLRKPIISTELLNSIKKLLDRKGEEKLVTKKKQ